jgi:hypothetical protein
MNGLVVYGTVWLGKYVPTFQINMYVDEIHSPEMLVLPTEVNSVTSQKTIILGHKIQLHVSLNGSIISFFRSAQRVYKNRHAKFSDILQLDNSN